MRTRVRRRLKSVDWVRVNKWATVLLMIVLVLVLGLFAHSVDWTAVLRAVRAYSAVQVALAFALTAASYALYGVFDLFGRHAIGHQLPILRVMSIAAMSYAFNLTLGTVIGAAGIRLRLYQRAGLSAGEVARVIGTSMLTNWLGYALVAGVLFASGLVRMPASWGAGALGVRAVGLTLLALLATYLIIVMRRGGQEVHVSKYEITLPRASKACLQVCVAALNWLVIGLVLYCLLDQRVAYPVVLGSTLVASVAGLVSRVPGGVGVLEAVTVGVLGRYVAHDEALAAVLTFRAVYYLVPLMIAAAIFAATEAHHASRER